MPKAIFAKHGMATKHDWVDLYVLISNDLFSYVTDPIVRALPQKTSAQIVPEGRTKFPKTWTAQETCPTSRRPVKRLFDNHQRLCCQSPPAPNCLLDMNFCRCSKLQSSLPQGNWSSIPEKGEVRWFCKNGSIYLGLNGVHIKLPSLQITFSFQSCSQTFTCSNISLSTGDCEMSFEQEETNQTETHRRSYATQPSWKFKWCSARCNVWKHKGCCYNPVCRERRSRACRWLNYLTGWLISSAVSWQQFFRENLPTPWQLAPWYLEMWDAGDSNPRHLLFGRRRTVIPRF